LRWRWLAWLLLALLLAAQYPLLRRDLTLGKLNDIRTAAAFVRARLQKDDPVLVQAFNDPQAMRYYLPGWRFIVFGFAADAPDSMCRKLAGTRRFGVLAYTSQETALRHVCGADYAIESITTLQPSPYQFAGAVWQRKPPASTAPALPTEPLP
jgi:hypothetical protein